MRDLPFMGPERDEWGGWLCGYAPGPGEPHCNRDATWHGFALDDECDHIAAVMESCDEHLGQMKLTVDYVHPLKHPCGIPGSRFRWPENECFSDWDKAAEFAAEAETAVTG